MLSEERTGSSGVLPVKPATVPARTPPWLRILPASVRARLAARPGLLAIVNNAGWLAGDKIVRLGLGVVIGVLVARTLGPNEFGVLSFATAIVALFGAVGSLGLDSIAVREFVGDQTRRHKVLGTVFALKLGGTAAASILVVAVAAAMRPGDRELWRISAIIAGGQLFLAFDAIDFWFQSRLQSRNTVVAKNGAFVLVALVRVALIVRRAPVEAFAWAAALEYGIGGIALFIVYLRSDPRGTSAWRFDPRIARDLLKASWPLMLSGLVIAVYMRIDQIMLAGMATNADVGTYSVAVRLAEVWYFMPVALASSTLPALLRSKAGDPEQYRRRSQRLFTSTVLIGYAIAIPTTLVAGPVIRLLYGQAYEGSVLPLIVLAWTGLFVCLGVARENWMLAEGLMKLSFATTASGAVVNVLLNFVLIPRYGPLGAAFATLAAQAVAVSLATLLFRSTRQLFPMQMRALTGGLIAGAWR